MTHTGPPKLAHLHTIGERLTYWREYRGYSKRQLAKLAHLSHTTVGHIEHNEVVPTIDSLQALAEALCITVRELLPAMLGRARLTSASTNHTETCRHSATLLKQAQHLLDQRFTMRRERL